VSSSSSPGSSGVVLIMRRYPLISFFVLAYVVTWLVWSPVLLSGLSVFSDQTHTPPLVADG
jgi:uncharacterized protein